MLEKGTSRNNVAPYPKNSDRTPLARYDVRTVRHVSRHDNESTCIRVRMSSSGLTIVAVKKRADAPAKNGATSACDEFKLFLNKMLNCSNDVK